MMFAQIAQVAIELLHTLLVRFGTLTLEALIQLEGYQYLSF